MVGFSVGGPEGAGVGGSGNGDGLGVPDPALTPRARIIDRVTRNATGFELDVNFIMPTVRRKNICSQFTSRLLGSSILTSDSL